SDATKLSANDSASFPFRFMDVHARAARDPHREQFFDDLVIVGSDNIDQLIAAGKLVAGSRADFAKTGIGVAVLAGLPKPDVSTSDAVKAAVLAAKSVVYSAGPSGAYIGELLKKLGIAE